MKFHRKPIFPTYYFLLQFFHKHLYTRQILIYNN